jgi:hypothetical protein
MVSFVFENNLCQIYFLEITIPLHALNGKLSLSVAVVRKRTILPEGPPLVGEVSAKLCG